MDKCVRWGYQVSFHNMHRGKDLISHLLWSVSPEPHLVGAQSLVSVKVCCAVVGGEPCFDTSAWL